MICKTCGNNMDDSLGYCDNCGGRIEMYKASSVYEESRESVIDIEGDFKELNKDTKTDKLINFSGRTLVTLVVSQAAFSMRKIRIFL